MSRVTSPIAINQRILNSLLYFQNKQPDSFVRQSFLISSELHTAGKNSFYSNLMKISEYFNFVNFSPDLVDTAQVTMFLQLMKQKYISYWQQTLQHSQKLEFYRSFKNEYATSSYLELTRRVSDRRTLTKLRISNHKLMIELGRYNDTPRQ